MRNVLKGLLGAGMMAGGLLSGNPLLAQLGLQSGGAILGSAFVREPEAPDLNPLLARARAERANSLRAVDEHARTRADRIEADAAAAGLSSSGAASALDATYRANNRMYLDSVTALDASMADTITQAAAQEEMMAYQQELARQQSRGQAISNILGAAGTMMALNPDALSGSGNPLKAAFFRFGGKGPTPATPAVPATPLPTLAAPSFPNVAVPEMGRATIRPEAEIRWRFNPATGRVERVS